LVRLVGLSGRRFGRGTKLPLPFVLFKPHVAIVMRGPWALMIGLSEVQVCRSPYIASCPRDRSEIQVVA
jgi:hypothetical protein